MNTINIKRLMGMGHPYFIKLLTESALTISAIGCHSSLKNKIILQGRHGEASRPVNATLLPFLWEGVCGGFDSVGNLFQGSPLQHHLS